MKRREMIKGKPVHTRKVEINTFDLGNHQVLVEGELLDTRPSSPEAKESGVRTIHHLMARVWVQGPDLTITDADAEMKRIPREGCPEALPAIQKLVGLRIISGYTQKVKDLIGDVKGCSHLTNLFLTMGPVAVQGYFAAYGRKGPARTPESPAFARILNSCHVWREDGPYIRSLMAALQKGKKED